MEVLREAMLRHETIFRDQVRELHRLYYAQRNLTAELLLRSNEPPRKMFSPRLTDAYVGVGLDEPSDAPSCYLATPKQQSTSYTSLHIDLNAPPDEDSSYVFHDPASMFSSPSTTSSTVQDGGSDGSCTGTPHPVSTVWKDLNNGYSFFSLSEYSRDQNADWLLVNEQSLKATANSWTQNLYKVDSIAHGSKVVGSEELSKDLVGKFTSGFSNGSQSSLNGSLPTPSSLYKLGDNTRDMLLDQEHSRIHSDSRIQSSTVTSTSNNKFENNMRASILSTNLPTSTKHLEKKQANCERTEDDTLSSHTAAEDEEQKDVLDESPVEGISNNSTEFNECNSLDRSSERLTFLSSATESGITQMDSLVTDLSPGKEIQEIGTCDIKCLNETVRSTSLMTLHDCGKMQQAKRAEPDLLIKKAAEILICLSLENLAVLPDQVGSSGSVELDAEERSNEPQYSSDSFETITLLLSEDKIEKYSTYSGPTVEETGKEACGLRLRRGRRLRDFRKEILPGLMPLSRHEICEDLHSFRYELRNNRSRNRKNWPIPARNRQSKRCSTRKRC